MPKVKNILVQKKYELIDDLISAGYLNISKHSSNTDILTAFYEYKGICRKKTLDGITKERAKEVLRQHLSKQLCPQ